MPIITNGTNGGATSAVWTIWVQTATTGAISCTTCATGAIAFDPWPAWTGSATTITNAATQVWTIWNGSTVHHTHGAVTTQRNGAIRMARGAAAAIVSTEERARREALEREYQQKLDAERAARKAAEAKAEELLLRLLTPEQKETLRSKRCFYLHTGGKRYRIDRGSHGNVKLVDDKDQVIESYCAAPMMGVPDADAMAAQKLYLEANPEAFKRVANISRPRDGSYVRGTPMPEALALRAAGI